MVSNENTSIRDHVPSIGLKSSQNQRSNLKKKIHTRED
jgi:hypothetical protein